MAQAKFVLRKGKAQASFATRAGDRQRAGAGQGHGRIRVHDEPRGSCREHKSSAGRDRASLVGHGGAP